MWVVTAAHCVRKKLFIRLGEYDLATKEGSELEFKVERAIKHPYYDSETVDNDIALLKFGTTGRAPSGHLPNPVCLPRGYQALPPTSSLCTIIGWGKRKDTDHYGTDILHEAQVPIVSTDECREVYEEYRITDNMFCAGYRGGRMDSCSGDSGGPLLCRESADSLRWTIHGITSFGEGCGRRGKFGIYTRMSNYVKWTKSVMRQYS
ncbi:trypsin-like [Nilaparvata lugens]|uniref:trypsin-like n=1 Tax=Nilaparvata lugens TaxID=108931 RepID=UPI00193D9BD1|nr:trypsin-like [Nilaparvata lugens]